MSQTDIMDICISMLLRIGIFLSEINVLYESVFWLYGIDHSSHILFVTESELQVRRIMEGNRRMGMV